MKVVEGLVQIGDNLYRIRKPYRNSTTNRYYIKTTCSKCGASMFQDRNNARRLSQPMCSKQCQYTNKPRKQKIKKLRDNGYHVQILKPKHPGADRHGRIYEHRWVVEQKLGRRLKPQERVHHINMIKHDNRPENLHVFSGDTSHFLAHGSLNTLVAELLSEGIIGFNRETQKYYRRVK